MPKATDALEINSWKGFILKINLVPPPWPLNTSARRIAVAVAIVELVNHVKMKSVKSTTQGGTQPCTKAWVEQVLLHECGP